MTATIVPFPKAFKPPEPLPQEPTVAQRLEIAMNRMTKHGRNAAKDRFVFTLCSFIARLSVVAQTTAESNLQLGTQQQLAEWLANETKVLVGGLETI